MASPGLAQHYVKEPLLVFLFSHNKPQTLQLPFSF